MKIKFSFFNQYTLTQIQFKQFDHTNHLPIYSFTLDQPEISVAIQFCHLLLCHIFIIPRINNLKSMNF
ncbi:hypothetical protein pb186bvf_009993 [Paramecium bursaria]